MRGNRGLVIFALVLIVLAALACAAYLYLQRSGNAPGEAVDVTPEAAPVETVDIVVAIQNVARGMQISVEDNRDRAAGVANREPSLRVFYLARGSRWEIRTHGDPAGCRSCRTWWGDLGECSPSQALPLLCSSLMTG